MTSDRHTEPADDAHTVQMTPAEMARLLRTLPREARRPAAAPPDPDPQRWRRLRASIRSRPRVAAPPSTTRGRDTTALWVALASGATATVALFAVACRLT